MTLTEFLDAALAAGVPADALERAGFSHSSEYPTEGEWRMDRDPLWSDGMPLDCLFKKQTKRATLAAERVVIEWFATQPIPTVFFHDPDKGWCSHRPTIQNYHYNNTWDSLSAALEAALKTLTPKGADDE
jgi:hypothetical protein